MSERRFFAIAYAVPLILFAAVIYLIATGTTRYGEAGRGNFGYDADPAGAREFAREVGSFREVGAEAVAKAEQKDVFLYRYVYEAHRRAYGKEWQCWDQGSAGTCVSFAFGLGAYTALAVDHIDGQIGDAPLACATEPIYGGARVQGSGRSSHPGGDGATGFGAARWLSGNCPGRPDIGGVLFRQKYGDTDLTTYSIALSREWGRSGVPGELAREAFKSRGTAIANVTDWESLVAAIGRGSPVVLCSSIGYGRADNRMPVRDEQGFLQRGKPWGHAMLVWGVRHDREGGCIQNSWSGSWCSGPKWPADQPDGSFWADRANIEAALQQGDCWAVGGITGFKWRELDHGMWLETDK